MAKSPMIAAFAATTALLAPSLASADDLNGSGWGYDVAPAPKPSAKHWALTDFFMGFGANRDHHLNRVGVLLDRTVNHITVALHDKYYLDDDDWFHWETSHQQIEDASDLRTGFVKKCVGECNVPVAQPDGEEVFVLSGFNFARERNTDAHIRRISIEPFSLAGFAEVNFSDTAADDEYEAKVQYTYVPLDMVGDGGTISGDYDGGDSVFQLTQPGAPLCDSFSQPVLQGFEFEFEGNDHHLARFAVEFIENHAYVQFSDKNSDDEYSVTLHYVCLYL